MAKKKGTPEVVAKTLTHEQQKEYMRCMFDVAYFAETYCQVKEKATGRKIPFKLFPHQIKTIEAYQNHRFNLILKYRQGGITTTTCLYIAWLLTFTPNCEIAVVANTMTLAQENIFTLIVDIINNLPDWLRMEVQDKDSQKKKVYENGSVLQALAAAKDGTRGMSPDLVFVDEAAYLQYGEQFMTATMGALSAGGNIILNSCVPKETLLFTPEGIREMGDYVTPDVESRLGYHTVAPYRVLGRDAVRTGQLVFNNGLAKTRVVTTRNGRVEGTDAHKLWGYNAQDDTWGIRTMGELQVNDYVAIQYGMDIWGNQDSTADFTPTPARNIRGNVFAPKEITADIAYFLGLYLAEGYSRSQGDSYTTVITCGDDISDCLNRLGLKWTLEKDAIHYRICSKNLHEFFNYLGFDLTRKAPAKEFPQRLLSLSRENTAAMLRGFFDGDGYSRKDRGIVGVQLASKRMVEQIRMMLLNFGILTDWTAVTSKPTVKVACECQSYRILLNGRNSLRFYDLIGFGFERKQHNREVLARYDLTAATTKDIIPGGRRILRDLLKRSHLTQKAVLELGIGSDLFRKSSGTPNVSREVFLRLLPLLDPTTFTPEEQTFVADNVSAQLIWNRVDRIDESEAYTYDFSLPDVSGDINCHSVVYNGFWGFQTPKGMDPVYYAKYEQSLKGGENAFNVVEIFWYQDPRFIRNSKGEIDLRWIKTVEGQEVSVSTTDPDVYYPLMRDGYKPTSSWFEKRCADYDYDPKRIAQELSGSFIGSGGNLIADEYILEMERTTVCAPGKTNEKEDGKFWFWPKKLADGTLQYIKPDGRYLLWSDVSKGTGEDYSSIEIFEVLDDGCMEQMAELQCKYPPEVLAERINTYGRMYNNAYVVVDVTGGIGAVTMDNLLRLGYPLDCIHQSEIRNKPIRDRLLKHMNEKQLVPGFAIGANRDLILEELERRCRHGEIIVKSKRLTTEFKSFVFINGRYDHERSKHDDLLMAVAMGLYAFKFSFGTLQGPSFEQVLMQANAWKTVTQEDYDQEWMVENHKNESQKYVADPFRDDVFSRDSPVLPFYF